MSSDNHVQSNIHKSFQTPGVAIAPTPALTSFSNRNRLSGQNPMSSHSLLDTTYRSSPYQNRGTVERTANQRSPCCQEDAVELPPEMQGTIANRYQQALKKSNVIRIDTRNFSTPSSSPAGSLKRRLSSSLHTPTSPPVMDSRSVTPSDREMTARQEYQGRGYQSAKNYPANSAPRDHKTQASQPLATTPLLGAKHSQAHDVKASVGATDFRSAPTQDATLPYSSKRSYLSSGDNHVAHESKNGGPAQQVDRNSHVTNGRSRGPRVTFATDEKENSAISLDKSNSKANKAAMVENCTKNYEQKKLNASQKVHDEARLRLKYKRRYKISLFLVLDLILLLLITGALLIYFAVAPFPSKTENTTDTQTSQTSSMKTTDSDSSRPVVVTRFTQPPQVTLQSRKPQCTDRNCFVIAGSLLSKVNFSVDPCSGEFFCVVGN